jgi:hypothetical protein
MNQRVATALVFSVAVALYLPTLGHGFVQDDFPIIAGNANAHSIAAALAAFNDPFWPLPSLGGMYRPLTILSFAIDWTISGGSPGWLHFMNALLHGIAVVLVTLVARRWFTPLGALAVGLVFAVHPVHVEGVANLVSRAEILAAIGVFGTILCARRGWWAAAVLAAAFAMFSKEHGVIAPVLVAVDDWLGRREGRGRYPRFMYAGQALVAIVFIGIWLSVGRHAGVDQAPAFVGAEGLGHRLANALPAIWRAATLMVWPVDLVIDYGPQVLPVRDGFSVAALGGTLVMGLVVTMLWWSWRRHPGVFLFTLTGVLAFLPTSNLFFSVGVVLAERTLYLPIIIVAGAAGLGIELIERRRYQMAIVATAVISLALGWRSWTRVPIWESNRTFLLTTLFEHPESYRAHVWAASLLSGIGDTAAARREYRRAEDLFDRDPHLDAAHGYFLMMLGDSGAARPRIERARRVMPLEPFALRADFLLRLARRDTSAARALADTATSRTRIDATFYRERLR